MPWLRSAREGRLLQRHDGEGPVDEAEGGLELGLARQPLRLADLLERAVRELGAGANVVVDEEELAEQAADCEARLVEVIDAARVDEVGSDQLRQNAYEAGFSVISRRRSSATISAMSRRSWIA